jgi:erythromycin esterase
LPGWRDRSAGGWAFFGEAARDKSIVLLGESLHVTAELPLVRLPMVEHLHRNMGFDVVAFEGSMIDAWLAQDDLLRAPDEPDAVQDAAAAGWLTLWNTPEMRQVLGYIHETRHSERLYFASMDIQPAMGGHPRKRAVLRRFVERVFEYAGVPKPEAAASALEADLDALRSCAGRQPPPPERLRAVARLSEAIRKADKAVRARSDVHADALALVPGMIEQRLRHCAESVRADGSIDWKVYKEARDRYQASNVLALRDKVSRKHRVVVWGHHTHVAYGAAGANAKVSIAGALRETAPGQTYAVGLYGGSGTFLRIQDGPREGISSAEVPRPGDARLSGLDALRGLDASEHGYFLDLKVGAADPRLAFTKERHGYPLEGDAARAVLADEFDAVVFLPVISETRFGWLF